MVRAYRAWAVGAVVGLAAVSAASGSVLLGSTTLAGGFQRANPNGVPYTSAFFGINFDDPNPANANPANALFADIPQNATGIFLADASFYPAQFPTFANLMTNGVPDTLYFFYGFSTPTFLWTGAGSGPEAVPIGASPAVDFTGFTLTSVRQVINSFTIGPGTLNGGLSTQVTYNVTYQYYGEAVPAPGVAGVLLIGVGVGACRWRRGR